MCYDIKKGNDIEKKQVDNIDHITQVINLYDINELVTIKEFRDTEDEFRIYLSKCPSDCADESVFIIFHAFRHYRYLIELTFVNVLLKVFVKIHRDFQLEEYLIKFNGEVKFNLLHRESGYNYYLTLDFSNEGLLIKKSFFNI